MQIVRIVAQLAATRMESFTVATMLIVLLLASMMVSTLMVAARLAPWATSSMKVTMAAALGKSFMMVGALSIRRSMCTMCMKVPVNHYVHVKMPQQPPIVHTVKVMAPAKTYSCNGVGDQPDPSWSDKHTRWCCYKYGTFCPKTVIDKNIYHTVVKKQPVKVPVPEPMPTHPPIVKTIHHTYHVPSPPRYVHVPVPGPTVVKNVVVPENVPVPVPEPPQVINVKKPYTVHVPGKNHYVHVPDCHAGFSDWHSLWSHAKQRWCCSNKFVGCPGSWHGAIAHTTHVTHVHHIHHYHSGSYPDVKCNEIAPEFDCGPAERLNQRATSEQQEPRGQGFEADPDAVKTEERWVYVGQGGGSYSQVSNMEMVGAGRGEFEKQKTTTVGGPSTAPDLALVVLQQLKVIFYKALEQRP
eukprot:g27715.t2